CDQRAPLLFTENETNTQRISGEPNQRPWVKDGINNYVVHGQRGAVNPAETGTKAAAHYRITVAAGQSVEIKLRLAPVDAAAMARGAFGYFNTVLQTRRREADAFYASITPASVSHDAALVMRQALAGMLWRKQVFC